MRYDFTDHEKIQFAEYCCPTCLVYDFFNALQYTRDYECVDIIAHADTITEVLRNLLNLEIEGKEFKLGMVDIDGVGCDYKGEYILTINDNFTIWIEPAYRFVGDAEKLFDTEAYLTFIHGDCDSNILQKLEKRKAKVLIFDFEENE